MKKLLTFSLYLIFLSPLLAQELPTSIKSAFQARFSGAEILNHIATGNSFIVMFRQNDQAGKATFDQNGNWQETIAVIPATEAPQQVKDYLSSTYADQDFKDFWRIEQPGETYLKASSATLAVFFDTEGNFKKTEEVKSDDQGLLDLND